MRRFLITLLLCVSGIVSNAQLSSLQIDSLSSSINRADNSRKRLIRIEHALDAIAQSNPDQIKDLLDEVDYSKLSTHHLLLIDAFQARSLTYQENIEELLALTANGNPFIKFYQGTAHFLTGKNEDAIRLNLEATRLFDYYNDTIYIASCYNNIGAVHWHLNDLDSALYYFLKAKSYTYWFNEMLENNILAMSNALENRTLSKQQIETIRLESDPPYSPYFLNNTYSYYRDIDDQAALDSMEIVIKASYGNISEVPPSILPVFIRNNWYSDSLSLKLLELPANSYYDNALRSLLTSPLVGDSTFTKDVMLSYAAKTNSKEDSVMAHLMSLLDGTQRKALAQSLYDIIDETHIENSEKLAYSSRSFIGKIEAQEFKLKQYTVVGMVLASIALLTIILLQRKKITETRERLLLADRNIELSKENDLIQVEIQKARKGIEEIATNSMREVKKLRLAINDIVSNPAHASELMDDLNVITTHEEGMLRFKIKRLVEGLTSPSFERLSKVLNPKESQILKLTLLEFRSKEVASLLSVSPQHINNVRSKIKSKVEDEMKEDYDSLIEQLSREFFLQ